jgi:hypothetical protein
VDVATGRARINDANDSYRRLYGNVASELVTRGLRNPVPFGDLWDWYTRWNTGNMPTYHSRRLHISELLSPLISQLRTGRVESFEPTGWVRVDRTLDQVRDRLATAQTEEQYQTVGLLSREALISLAQAVYDPTHHAPPDGVAPSATDAKRMLDGYITAELPGGSNEEARRHLRSALDLALALQHQRTAGFRDAAICAEATTAVTNLVAIVSGRRG